MRVHLLSDLHTGHHPYGAATVCADVLALPGDISDGSTMSVVTVAADYLAQGKPVMYVAGNHEFYGTRYPQELRKLHRQCRKAGVTFLHNRSVVVNGVRFIGATLWTDFKFYGEDKQAASEFSAKHGISDFSLISDGKGRCITPAMTTRWHAKSLRILEARLAEPFDGPTVVLTHHAPDEQSVHPRWRGHAVNPAFVSNLRALILKYQPALWGHGHVHDSFSYPVGKTPVVANPQGYVKKLRDKNGEVIKSAENPAFNPLLVVSV
jgi:Icc-related predicted phosphoesterase